MLLGRPTWTPTSEEMREARAVRDAAVRWLEDVADQLPRDPRYFRFPAAVHVRNRFDHLAFVLVQRTEAAFNAAEFGLRCPWTVTRGAP